MSVALKNRLEFKKNKMKKEIEGSVLDQSFQLKSPDDEMAPEKTGREKALEDFGKLLSSGTLSDLVFRVQNQRFQVHSPIIAVRSPALFALLRPKDASEDIEKEVSASIVIDDCHPDIFMEFLCYLYTGTVQNLESNVVFDLYRTACKYKANDLKLLCREKIQGILCVENICEVLKLAVTNDDEFLLKCATDFSIEHFWPLINCTQWKELIKEHPTETNEILTKAVRPKFTEVDQSLPVLKTRFSLPRFFHRMFFTVIIISIIISIIIIYFFRNLKLKLH